MAKTPGKTKQVLTGFCPRAFSLIAVVRARCSERLLRAYSVEKLRFRPKLENISLHRDGGEFWRVAGQNGLKALLRPLEAFRGNPQ
jgi:hypothetical protein